MTKIKYNKDGSTLADSQNSRVSDNISLVNTAIGSFESTISSKISEFEKFSDIVACENDDGTTTYSSSFGGRSSTDSWFVQVGLNLAKEVKIAAFKAKAGTITEAVNNLTTKIKEKSGKYKDLLTKLATSVSNFENGNYSLSEVLEELQISDITGVSFEIANKDGAEVVTIYYTYTDENGNEITVKLSEAVNSFYTYVGSATSGLIANEIWLNEQGDLSPEEREEYRVRALRQTGAQIDAITDSGLMQIASTASISGFYASFAKDHDLDEDMEVAYKSMIKSCGLSSDAIAEIMGEDTNSVMAAGGALLAAGFAEKLGFKEKLTEKDKKENKQAVKTAKDKKTKIESYVEERESLDEIIEELKEQDAINEKKAKEQTITTAEWPPATDLNNPNGIPSQLEIGTDISDLLSELLEQKENSENNDSIFDIGDPTDSEVTDFEADRISDLIDKIKDSEFPSRIDKGTRAPAEIDSEARDTYFEKIGDDLYEHREQQINEYREMSDSEKVEALEELGYSKSDAAKLVAAPAAGQTAYVYGKFTQSLSNASNNIAAAEGFNNFVSAYDNKTNLANIMNKTANVDLTPTSENVQNARQQLSTAKGKYDESVNKANKAVDKAADAKNKYNKVLKDIQDKNGEDPKNWTDEQVDEYNEAATMYNDAVEEAQRAAEEVESAKQSYNQEKEQYQAVYDKWRDEAEEDVGMTGVEVNNSSSKPDDSNIHYNDTSSSSGGGQAENIDDSSISLDSNSSTNTGGGQVNGASQSKPGGNSGVTVDDSGLSIGNPVPDNGPTNNIETGTSTGTESVSDSSINIGGSDNVNDNIMDEYPVMEDGKPVMTEEVKPNTDGITEI